MRRHILPIVLALLPSALSATVPADFSVTKRTFEENPSGLTLTLYARGKVQETTQYFGIRSYIRDGFFHWIQLEVQPGVYDWTSANGEYQSLVSQLRQVHRAGSTPMCSVDIGFNTVTSFKGGKSSIPSFYPSDIRDPTTRAAALAFARAFTQKLLTDVGDVVLLVDYECCYNYNFAAGPTNRAIFHDWFIQVCGVIAQAATDSGKRAQLKIAINFNTDVFTNAETLFGAGSGVGFAHVPQTWVLECCAAADVVSLDDYYFDPGAPTDVTSLMNNIEFMTSKYCGTKPFYIMENGYSSSSTDASAGFKVPANDAGKGNGTRTDQATYFTNLGAALPVKNASDGSFGGKLRAFSIWMINDFNNDNIESTDDYDGLLDQNWIAKPAYAPVKAAMVAYEISPINRPSRQVGTGTDVTSAVAAQDGSTVLLTHTTGRAFDDLRCTFTLPPGGTAATLTVKLTSPGSLVVYSNETGRTNAAILALAQTQAVDVTNLVQAGPNTLDLRISGDVHPSTLAVDQVRLDYTPGKTPATVTLGNLSQTYSGSPVAATATTSPVWLNVSFTYNGSATVPTSVGAYAVVATVNEPNYTGSATGTLAIKSVVVPAPIATPPLATPGTAVTLTAVTPGATTYQWQCNGTSVTGGANGALTLANLQPAATGLYTATATNLVGPVASQAAIVGVATTNKVIGTGTEIAHGIYVASNGNTFDQVLPSGAAVTVTAEPRKITRTSFVDLTNDIVQVEFSGAGTLSLVLDNASGPATAVSYNQPDTVYMKGHAGIVIAGADDTTNLSVFSVGPLTAVNQALFKSGVTYEGMADLAFIAIASTNGKFGSVRTANASYYAAKGYTGIYAPGVQFTGPVYVGDINASAAATPVLLLGSVGDARVAGGDLFQANAQPVKVSGIAQLQFTAGSTSHGVADLPAQHNRAVLQQDGIDVTAQTVVNPAP